MRPGNLCLLVPVWPAYRWLAPLMAQQLTRHWPDHPPVRFCGMAAGEAVGLPHYARSAQASLTNWSGLLLEGVRQARAEGFELAYLLAEEHLPLGPCHPGHLNVTLPACMESLPAVYIGLMGWDNRRFTSRSPVLDATHHQLKHLVQDRDPRFHLHPALWQLDVLEACCELALRDPSANGSAWHFEKINDKDASPHPAAWKRQCYQIRASRLALRPPGALRQRVRDLERFLYHKAMAIYPLIPHRALANAYARRVGFDDFFCDGPYPMFFSGIMAKGRMNPYCVKFLRRSAGGRALLDQIEAARTA
jgi:hypothetical protein